MKDHLLRFSIAVLTFSTGLAIVTALAFYHSPVAAIEALPVPDVVAPSPSPPPSLGREKPALPRRVTGRVRDREGHPVGGALVSANPHGPVSGIIPHGVSEADGSFALDVWWRGAFTITAEHLGEGYPDATNGLYGSFFAELPVVTVDGTHDVGAVEVTVGPKAGRVVFKIVDERSGKPVRSGLIEVCRADDPQRFMSMSTAFPRGEYEMLVSEVPFTIKFKVWARGWEERLAIGEDGSPVETIQVGLGERKELTVKLRRIGGGR